MVLRTKILNPKSEARNKYQIQIFKCSKRNQLKTYVCCFGHLKLGPRPQGGESGGPILVIRICFGFRYSDFGFTLKMCLSGKSSISSLRPS
jgi:hypothetical protein